MTPKQLDELREIARGYANFECIDCALAMRKYLVDRGIDGNLIKISTGANLDPRNFFLYDDSVPGDAISESGYHEGICITIDGQEIAFDNHHPEGILKTEWLSNFQFFGKLHLGQELIVIAEPLRRN